MNKSENIGQLAAALAKAQRVMGGASKDASNPFFKSHYSTLASVIDAIREPLTSNGLSFVQLTQPSEKNEVVIETVLMHESGEWISAITSLPVAKADAQGYGSAITYGKRYGIQALTGCPSEDDDGNAATHQAAPAPKPVPAKPMPAKVKEAAAALKPHAKGTISGDPNEGNLDDIAPAPPPADKPDGATLGQVINAFATKLNMTAQMVGAEYNKPMAEWTNADVAEARELFKHLLAERKAMAGDGGEV